MKTQMASVDCRFQGRASWLGVWLLALLVQAAWLMPNARAQTGVEVIDTTPPECVSATASLHLSNVVVRFSEPVNSGPAGDSFNYLIPGFDVRAANTNADGMSVTLTVDSSFTPDTVYSVTIRNMFDLSGNLISPDPCTLSFRTPVISCGIALQELYLNIGGGVLLSDLRSSPTYPNSPSLTRYKGSLEANTADEFDNYGTRLSGFVIAPVSGDYNFFMSSDDQGEFWLSTDSSPVNMQLIAREPVYGNRRDWTSTFNRNPAAPENRSSTLFPAGIPLVAGQSYYFEALMKEGNGGDHLGVAWQLPGAPAPLNGSAPISGAHLAALVDPAGASVTIVQQPTDVIVVLTGSVNNATFTVGVNGTAGGSNNPPLFCQWYRNSGSGFVPIPGANSSTYSLTPTLADNGARFRVQCYVPGATATSTETTLTVVQPNTPPQFTKGPDQCIVQNAGVQSAPGWATNIQVHSIDRVPVVFATDFSSLPAGTRILDPSATDGVVPRVEDGVLKLSNAENLGVGGFGGWAMGPFPEQTFESFQASWRSRVGGGGNGGADGYSLNIGTNLADNFQGEEGTGSGLSVTVDTFDNGTGLDVGIDVKWMGARVAYAAVAKDNDGSGVYLRKDAFVDATLNVTAGGLTTLNYDGTTVSAQLPGYAGLTVNQVNFGAREGGANDRHWIDDLSFAGFPPNGSGAEAGQTISFIVSNDNPGLFSAQPSISPSGTLSYTPAPNACGTATVTVVAMDSGGTTFGGDDTSDPQTFVIKILCGPDLNCPGNIVAECTGGLTLVTFKATAVDTNGDPVPVTCVPPSGTGFRIGTSNVVCTATSAGVSTTCAFTVTVVDTTPPQVTCNTNITVRAASAAGAVVPYIAGAFDACGIASFDCSPPAGSTFPIGVTTVVCRAIDGTGNSNSCSFTVTVNPLNQCPAASNLTVSLDMNGSVNFQLPASDPDNNPLQYVVTQPPAHGSLAVQANTGGATYTPAVGYCGSDSFRFKVNDGICDSAEATVTIEVRCTARGLKQAVLAELIAARATATSSTDQDRLDKGIDYLTVALDSSLWIDDNHLVPKLGQAVFQKEKDAVNKLNDLMGDSHSEIPAATLQGWMDRLVQADRILAVLSVDEAEAAGANPAKIAQDRGEIARGDADAAAGREENAIEHYRNAWKHAVHLQARSSLSIAGGHVRLEFLTLPGEQYVIQASTDFVNWTTLTTVTANGSGVIDFVDSSAPGQRKRFYRVVQP